MSENKNLETHLLEEGKYRVQVVNTESEQKENKPISIEDKIQIWNLIWKIVSELWFMIMCSYVTYYVIYIFSYCVMEHLNETGQSHNSINSQASWSLGGFGNLN